MTLYQMSTMLLIPAFIFAMSAQFKVKSSFGRYSKIATKKHMTGSEVARRILNENNLGDMPIEMIGGELSDHYDSRKRVIRLSQSVYNGNSIASISVAAHEVGHAIQHSQKYSPLVIRNMLAGPARICSGLSWIFILGGIILMQVSYEMQGTGTLIFNMGAIAFFVIAVFQFITLPVEFNASRRAMATLQGMDILDEEELVGARKMLSAAAMTYVAAMAVTMIQLLRILAMAKRD